MKEDTPERVRKFIDASVQCSLLIEILPKLVDSKQQINDEEKNEIFAMRWQIKRFVYISHVSMVFQLLTNVLFRNVFIDAHECNKWKKVQCQFESWMHANGSVLLLTVRCWTCKYIVCRMQFNEYKLKDKAECVKFKFDFVFELMKYWLNEVKRSSTCGFLLLQFSVHQISLGIQRIH